MKFTKIMILDPLISTVLCVSYASKLAEKKGGGKKFDKFYEIKPNFQIELPLKVYSFLKWCMGKVVPSTWAWSFCRQGWGRVRAGTQACSLPWHTHSRTEGLTCEGRCLRSGCSVSRQVSLPQKPSLVCRLTKPSKPARTEPAIFHGAVVSSAPDWVEPRFFP